MVFMGLHLLEVLELREQGFRALDGAS